MRIAMIFDGLRFGGIERVGLDYIKIFRHLGYEVTVYNLRPQLFDLEKEIDKSCKIEHIGFPRWLAPERYAAAIKKVWWGKYIYPAAFLLMSFIGLFYRPFLRCTKREMRTRYDVAIAFSGHMNDLTFVANDFVKCKKKVAWLHGALYGYAIISPAFLRLYSKIKNLVSLSDMCDAELYSFMKENSIYKKTIYNPICIKDRKIDEEIVEELKEKYSDFCLMVARMDNDKDQMTAIKAIEILKKKYSLEKKLILVGDGENIEKLKEFVRANNLDDQVIFVGKRADVQNYYSAAKVYIHSSPLEGLPTVLLEAMSYHLPIASTDSIPGVREILQNERYGLISDIFDADGLANNVFKLYTDAELVKTLTTLGEKRLKDFSPEIIETHIQDYLQSI